MLKRIHEKIKGYYVFIVLIILWKLICELQIWNEYILPPPEKVFKTFIKMCEDKSIYINVYASIKRILIGFLVSGALAIPLGILLGINNKIYQYIKPLFEFMRNTPPLALVPILILWFGIGEESKIIIIILASFFPIFTSTLKGIVNCDYKLIEVGKIFGFTKIKIISKIIVPNAMLDIVVGLKLALGYSFRAIIGAELIAASSGLGYLISDGKEMSRTDIVIVGILVIGFLGILSDYIFSIIVSKVSKGKKVETNE